MEKENDDVSKSFSVASILGLPSIDVVSAVLKAFFKDVEENSKDYCPSFYNDAYFAAVFKKFAEKNNIDLSQIHFLNPILVRPLEKEELKRNFLNTRFKSENGQIYELGPLPDIRFIKENTIIIPVNLGNKDNKHWNAAIIDKEARKIYYFEPLGSQKHMSCHAAQELLKLHFKKQELEFEADTSSVTVQHDGHNCGPLSLQFALGFAANASTNLTSLRNHGITREILIDFLSVGIDKELVKNSFKKQESESLGQAIRKFQVGIAKEVAQDIYNVFNDGQNLEHAR